MTAGYGVAWLALCIGLAIHVADEALTDFLSVYNPTVGAIRARFPFLPLPTYTFPVWLGGLAAICWRRCRSLQKAYLAPICTRHRDARTSGTPRAGNAS